MAGIYLVVLYLDDFINDLSFIWDQDFFFYNARYFV
jgi:hypothetical protein